MPAVEVAALSGHAMPLTTERWYGQKKSAWLKKYLKAIARPDPEEVQMIMQRVAMAKQHEAKLAQIPESGAQESIDPLDVLPFIKR
jgi:hypothetical protein